MGSSQFCHLMEVESSTGLETPPVSCVLSFQSSSFASPHHWRPQVSSQSVSDQSLKGLAEASNETSLVDMSLKSPLVPRPPLCLLSCSREKHSLVLEAPFVELPPLVLGSLNPLELILESPLALKSLELLELVLWPLESLSCSRAKPPHRGVAVLVMVMVVVAAVAGLVNSRLVAPVQGK